MSWSRENLWALSTKRKFDEINLRRTLFQQRWIAKREVRGYHVPNITEKQFLSRYFTKKFRMQWLPESQRSRLPSLGTLLTAELERRIDVVVFRSHFAKSIFQARRMVSRGYVKLNGEPCTVPCTKLNDGDMITVDPNYIPTLKGPRNVTRKFNYVPYMAPHLFIPAYLEVNYPTCSTIFLRSPLPQPDAMEIPSPHPPVLHQLAMEWYSGVTRKKTRAPRDHSDLIVHGSRVLLKPKFDSIMRTKQLKDYLERRGVAYRSRKKVKITARGILRPRYVPKRDRYAEKNAA